MLSLSNGINDLSWLRNVPMFGPTAMKAAAERVKCEPLPLSYSGADVVSIGFAIKLLSRAQWIEMFHVKPSVFDGMGLFAARDFCVGDIITTYAGEKKSKADASKIYTFQSKSGNLIDASGGRALFGAHYMNHSSDGYNCQLTKGAEEHGLKEGRVRVVVAVSKGDELLLRYGNGFNTAFSLVP